MENRLNRLGESKFNKKTFIASALSALKEFWKAYIEQTRSYFIMEIETRPTIGKIVLIGKTFATIGKIFKIVGRIFFIIFGFAKVET